MCYDSRYLCAKACIIVTVPSTLHVVPSKLRGSMLGNKRKHQLDILSFKNYAKCLNLLLYFVTEIYIPSNVNLKPNRLLPWTLAVVMTSNYPKTFDRTLKVLLNTSCNMSIYCWILSRKYCSSYHTGFH